ncbi:MAG: hypothetical protein WC412_08215 [Candidatus Omnitrophota bacterium]|jgi:hypothetical protein
MRNRLLFLSLILTLLLSGSIAGCAFMEKMLPNQVDASGQIIPGTHTASATEQAAAGMIPYGIGSVLLNAILFAWNGYEKFKSKKLGTGLTSTLSALNQVKNDPALSAQWDLIKQTLEDAHTVANVQPLIKQLLARL